MSPEEAIKKLQVLKHYTNPISRNDIAIDTAIEALKKQIPESAITKLKASDGSTIYGCFCPACHDVLVANNFYIKRCNCGKALSQTEWEY